jgi:murein L,D-transpeptidase YafK
LRDLHGPNQPIGHSVSSEADKKRIAELLARESAAIRHGQPLGDEDHLRQHAEPAKIPAAIITLGATSRYALVVEKLHHRLSVYENKQGTAELVKSYRAITGKQLGDKVRRGDLKTPEGLYFITGKKEGRTLPPKYGPAAFTLDFPNIYDQQQRKTGSGIWIHGVLSSERILKAFDTEGCVALANDDLLDLEKYLAPLSTPVVITSEVSSVEDSSRLQKEKELALQMIEGWRTAWEQSDFVRYSSYYSNQFRTQGLNRQGWLAHKSTMSSRRGDSIRVKLSQPSIVAFEDQLLATFQQRYDSTERKDNGYKFLYMKWEGDRYRIISEKWIQNDVLSRIAFNRTSSQSRKRN